MGITHDPRLLALSFVFATVLMLFLAALIVWWWSLPAFDGSEQPCGKYGIARGASIAPMPTAKATRSTAVSAVRKSSSSTAAAARPLKAKTI